MIGDAISGVPIVFFKLWFRVDEIFAIIREPQLNKFVAGGWSIAEAG
tara:strand:- start:187 stop:327 length:141 start_codon:yes stop_codon:yes gene_type:complete